MTTSDVDECAEGTSGCSQECTNTVGSFDCSCVDGYELARNGKACNGMYVAASVYTKHMCVHAPQINHAPKINFVE